MAKRTGLQQRRISVIETGYASIKLQTVLTIIAALDLDIQVVSR
ncbi:MAG TPA: helix-turn-helix domain-containing protein [Verrucomicrobiae bacterium]|nr:helix-turn-helix domain-containing protein [Verrucomicrobiae bacterium]